MVLTFQGNCQRFYGIETDRAFIEGADSAVQIVSPLKASKPRFKQGFQLYPEIEHLPGFDWAIGPGLVYTRPISDSQVVYFRASQVVNKVSNSSPDMTLELLKGEVEFKHYFQKRVFFSLQGGHRRFEADTQMTQYFQGRGHTFSRQEHWFASAGLGFQLSNQVLWLKRPLTANLSWAVGPSLRFPDSLPSGQRKVDFSGVRLGFGLGF